MRLRVHDHRPSRLTRPSADAGGMTGVPDLRSLPVEVAMTPALVTVSSRCGLMHAMDAVLGTGLRHLVVVHPDGTLRGILTAETLATTLMTHAAASHHTVGSLIRDVPTMLRAHEPVTVAAELMVSERVDAVAVVDSDGVPVGILTWSDLVRLMARLPHDTASGPPAHTVA